MKDYKYSLEYNNIDNKFKVLDKEGFAFGDSVSIKGAIIGALVVGIPLKDIDFNGYKVNIKDILHSLN